MSRTLSTSRFFVRLLSPTAPIPESLPPLDWPHFLFLAERHSLAPLLHERLGPQLSALPPGIGAALHRAHTAAAAHAMFQQWELRRLVAAFEAAGMPLLLWKGLPLARQLFGDAALRPTVDIDVLVPRDTLDAACALIEAEGWRPHEAVELFEDKDRSFLKEVAGATIVLEVHWTTQRAGEFDLPEARLWAETVRGEEGLLFTPEMTVLTLALHTLRHAFRPYRQLVDLAQALAVWEETLDWERVVQLAREAGALPVLATVLALVCRDMPVPPPRHHELRRRMQSTRTRLALRLLPLEPLLVAPTLGSIERYWIAALHGAWHPARWLLGDLLRPPAQIAEIYGLPRRSPLVPLFYLLRPLLLARKYLASRLSR